MSFSRESVQEKSTDFRPYEILKIMGFEDNGITDDYMFFMDERRDVINEDFGLSDGLGGLRIVTSSHVIRDKRTAQAFCCAISNDVLIAYLFGIAEVVKAVATNWRSND